MNVQRSICLHSNYVVILQLISFYDLEFHCFNGRVIHL